MTWTLQDSGRWLLSASRVRGVLLIMLVGLVLHSQYYGSVRSQVFDLYQSAYPRVQHLAPVVIIAIDEKSLQRHGQWPWPRTWLARIVGIVAAARPAAIGIDILMPEPDRLSPGRLPDLVSGLDRDVARRLGRLPSNDSVLAQAIQGQSVVLGVAGLESEPDTPTAGRRQVPVNSIGGDPTRFLRRFAGGIYSIAAIDAAAAGRGLTSMDPERGVVRRMPLLASVGDALVPGLALEMLRVARDAPGLSARAGRSGVEAVGIGDLFIPTERDARVWLHYRRSDPSRFISAADVLAGSVPPERLQDRFVLIGATAFGLADYHTTPVIDRMAGVELHAQLIENMVEGSLLSRPQFSQWFGLGLLLLIGLPMRCVYDRVSAWRSVAVTAVAVAVLVLVCIGLFVKYHVLLDPIPASLAIIVVLAQYTLEKVIQLARLKRFFSPRLADLIVEGGAADPGSGVTAAKSRWSFSIFVDSQHLPTRLVPKRSWACCTNTRRKWAASFWITKEHSSVSLETA